MLSSRQRHQSAFSAVLRLIPHLLQLLAHQSLGVHQIKAKLGVAVQIAADGLQLGLQRGRLLEYHVGIHQ